MASATQAQRASQGFAQTSKKSTLGPKLVAGLGACVMLGAIVAITTSDENSSSAAASLPPVPAAIVAQNVPATPAVANPSPPAAMTAPLPAVAAISAPAPPPPAVAQVPPRPTQCELAQRRFYVAGNGIVRIHAGEYVSAPVTLGPYAQTISFPASRPAPGAEAIQTIVIEGSASTVVMTSDLPGFRRVITGLRGESSFTAKWQSLGNC